MRILKIWTSELGFATHFIPSRRIPILLDRLAVLENAHPSVIDNTIEEFSSERQLDEAPTPFTGVKRDALDFAFRHNRVEDIFADLESFVTHKDTAISQWAAETIATLNLRSPTSLKVALKAIRKGKNMTLLEALEMELKIATAYCVSIRHPYIAF
jgi:3-hydroxyisobutyryl-CoA hydrolase